MVRKTTFSVKKGENALKTNLNARWELITSIVALITTNQIPVSSVNGLSVPEDDGEVCQCVVEEAVRPVVLDALGVGGVGIHPHVNELHLESGQGHGVKLEISAVTVRSFQFKICSREESTR